MRRFLLVLFLAGGAVAGYGSALRGALGHGDGFGHGPWSHACAHDEAAPAP